MRINKPSQHHMDLPQDYTSLISRASRVEATIAVVPLSNMACVAPMPTSVLPYDMLSRLTCQYLRRQCRRSSPIPKVKKGLDKGKNKDVRLVTDVQVLDVTSVSCRVGLTKSQLTRWLRIGRGIQPDSEQWLRQRIVLQHVEERWVDT